MSFKKREKSAFQRRGKTDEPECNLLAHNGSFSFNLNVNEAASPSGAETVAGDGSAAGLSCC